jgi:hypothetical protein
LLQLKTFAGFAFCNENQIILGGGKVAEKKSFQFSLFQVSLEAEKSFLKLFVLQTQLQVSA